MRWNFSPARNVRSTTAPVSRFFTFVRTNAPPLPGFTCWNSTMRQTPPSISMCMPFLNWFVLTTSATAENLVESPQFLWKRCQDLGLAVRDDDEILDTDPAQPGQVDARLDGADVAGFQHAPRLLGQARILLDEEAHPVPEAVPERRSIAGGLDPVARGGIDTRSGRAWTNRR